MTDWHLLIQDDEGSAVAVPLSIEQITLGREAENLIRLTQRNVSRKHAVITRKEDTFDYEDLGSSNGSFLNGQKIEAAVDLKNGDTIQIGDYVLQLYQGDLEQLRENNSPDIDMKTDPGINLAGLSVSMMEIMGQNLLGRFWHLSQSPTFQLVEPQRRTARFSLYPRFPNCCTTTSRATGAHA